MQIFPAIDLRGGQVVRLYQGDYDKERSDERRVGKECRL